MYPEPTVIVIPARLKSTRLDQKLLQDCCGKPLIWHTVNNALQSDLPVRLFTDSEEIADACEDLVDGDCFMVQITPEAHSGTERIAQHVTTASWSDGTLVVNLQADEPELSAEAIRTLADSYHLHPRCDIATLATTITDDQHKRMNVVKVQRGEHGIAVRFSRFPIVSGSRGVVYRHIGAYAYSVGTLKWTMSLPPAGDPPFDLEQMPPLIAGARIRVSLVDHRCTGIDTQQDLDEFRERLNAQKAREEESRESLA